MPSTPDTPDASSYRAHIPMQGFAAGDSGEQQPGGSLRTRMKDPGAGANPEPSSVRFLSSSVRSEPDLDTIMPLPGGYPHTHSSPAIPTPSSSSTRNWSGRPRHLYHGGGGGVVARAARAGAGGHEEASEESSEEEVDAERSLVHSPRSIGFTNVEVSLEVLSANVCKFK